MRRTPVALWQRRGPLQLTMIHQKARHPHEGACSLILALSTVSKIKAIGPQYGPIIWNPYLSSTCHLRQESCFKAHPNNEDIGKGPNRGPYFKSIKVCHVTLLLQCHASMTKSFQGVWSICQNQIILGHDIWPQFCGSLSYQGPKPLTRHPKGTDVAYFRGPG